jgi:hemolysin D
LSRKVKAPDHRRVDVIAVRQFQSETAAIREAPEPLAIRLTLWVLVTMIVSLVVLAAVTHIDRVVSNPNGKIVLARDLLNVYQALDASIIKSIDVREGELVRPGQVIATLDPTFAAADVRQLKLQIASLTAQIARDEAELAGKPLIYPPTDDPDLLGYEKIQSALHEQMMANYKAQIDSFDSKIKTLQATVIKFEADSSHYKQRGNFAKQIEDSRLALEAKGFGTLLNTVTSQDAKEEMIRFMEFAINSLRESRESLASAKADREAFAQNWYTQISQDLVTQRGNLDTANAQYEKAVKHQDLVVLKATEPSIVLTLAKLSAGSVLKQGDTLYTMMPANAELEAEIEIYSRDVAFARPGDRCNLKIDAFNFIQHGLATGTVRWISEGAFTTDDNGQALTDPSLQYYKARCTVDASGLVNVPTSFRLLPGMTLTGDVIVGTRSTLWYLLGGMLRGVGESMREPQ